MAFKTPYHLDVKEIIDNYMFNVKLPQQKRASSWIGAAFGRSYKGLKRDDFLFEINKSHLEIEERETSDSGPECDIALVDKPNRPNTLFKTIFKNNCSEKQEYSFRQERTTESSCTITREKSYSFGVESGITIKTPCEIVEANVGFQEEVSFTNATENSQVQTFTWSVDSTITVPPQHKTTAKLIVAEKEYSGKYIQVTVLRGDVGATIKKRKGEEIILTHILDIYDVFSYTLDQGNSAVKNMCSLNSADKSVTLYTEGTCRFKFATDQHVDVDEFPLTPSEKKKSE